jgi:DNA ligase-1
MKLPTLYSRTNTGAIEQWTLEVEGERYRTLHGQVGGIITETQWTIAKVKNAGRANQKTPDEQALLEAQSKWQKKVDKGYTESINDVDKISFIEVMLAKSYGDFKDDVTNLLEAGGVVYSQPKLDGIRCIVTKDGMSSRNGKPILAAPHILDALKQVFLIYPEAVFDGELYCDKFKQDFNKICSLVKKVKPEPADLKASKESIQYWIYDTLTDKSKKFSQRFHWLMNELSQVDKQIVKLVWTGKVYSVTQLDQLYQKYLENGMEGQMVRLDEPYEQKRSKFLLKRKEFQDDEFEIVLIGEGEGNKSGIAGYAVMKMKDGKQFRSNIKGTFEYCGQLLKDGQSLIGEKATIRYQNLTPDGIPRFPYLTAIRNYE